jgi:hypothetical protein
MHGCGEICARFASDSEVPWTLSEAELVSVIRKELKEFEFHV